MHSDRVVRLWIGIMLSFTLTALISADILLAHSPSAGVLITAFENSSNFKANETLHGNVDELPVSLQDASLLSNHSTVTDADEGGGASSMIEKIFLWTRSYKAGQEFELLVLGDNSSITSSHFEKHRPTYIIVHGFLGDGLEPWILDTKHKLLSLHDCNLVSVQWPSGSAYFVIDYYRVVGHVPVVGKEISQLLSQLEQLDLVKNSYVHIIGHSLGAHIAGFVGKNVATPIARISGLDPAGLRFRGTDASQRLDRTDADYVDVIHTNGCRNYLVWTDCFGIDAALGHTDFWPNGGRHQPACAGSWSVGCDHMMSHTYFVESLNYSSSSGLFLTRPCASYEQYTAGNCSCGPVPQYMGYLANQRARGNFYLNTSADPPYALPDRHCPTGAHAALLELCILVALLALLLIICLAIHMLYSCSRHSHGSCCCCCSGYKSLTEAQPSDTDSISGSCRSTSTPPYDPYKIVIVH